MKHRIIMFMLLATLSTFPARAGVPVISGAELSALMQQLLVMAEQVKELKSQLDEAKEQTGIFKQQIELFRGTRGIGRFMMDDASKLWRRYVPTEWHSLMELIETGAPDLRRLTDRYGTIARGNKIYPGTPPFLPERQRHDRKIARGYAGEAVAERSLRRVGTHLQSIEALATAIDSPSSDLKAAMDLNARATLLHAEIALDQTRLLALMTRKDAREIFEETKTYADNVIMMSSSLTTEGK